MTQRTDRVGNVIKEELGWMIEKAEIKDPRIGFVTITDVEVSRDLRHCQVYFSYLGKKSDREKAVEGLRSAAGFIRGELGRRLRLKYTPELEFKFDPSVETGARIAKVIQEIHREEDDGRLGENENDD